LGNELLDLFVTTAKVLATNGRSLTWNSSLPSKTSYYSAVYRLRKAGLIAYRRTGGRTPVLVLTEKGEEAVSDVHRPETRWKRKWNRIWYVLTYDVAEKDRRYRDALRRFLEKMRLGCLHKSVWVTPRDIRPEYADLVEAGGVDEFSYLLEARTVLGRSAAEVVRDAWDFDRINAIQDRFLDVYGRNLETLTSSRVSPEEAMALAREELEAYHYAMHDDPLLPSALLPRDYRGRKVLRLHQQITRHIAKRL